MLRSLQQIPCLARAIAKTRYRWAVMPPPPELFGPEQELPPGLQLAEQGQLPITPLGPLFEEQAH